MNRAITNSSKRKNKGKKREKRKKEENKQYKLETRKTVTSRKKAIIQAGNNKKNTGDTGNTVTQTMIL